jgi:hypothetical protein
MSTNATVRYVACWTEDDGIYYCGHEHESIVEAMTCLVPGGGNFIRAYEAGVSRSLDDREFLEFLRALPMMPWSSSRWALTYQ